MLLASWSFCIFRGAFLLFRKYPVFLMFFRPFDRTRHSSQQLTNGLFILFGLVIMLGCEEQDVLEPGQHFYSVSHNPYLQSTTERDSTYSLLVTANDAVFRTAFSKLSSFNYTYYTRSEQFDNGDYLIAFRERIVRKTTHNGNHSYVTLATDSAGTFDYGYFSHMVSETVNADNTADMVSFLLPKDPEYLSYRNRDAYMYRFLPDTLMWDTVARVVEIRAKPEEGDGQNVRRVRLYIDRGTRNLIGLYMERIDLAMLFREESRFYVHIRPSPTGDWVPYNTRFETRIRVPFRLPQIFRTVSTYYDYDTSG